MFQPKKIKFNTHTLDLNLILSHPHLEKQLWVLTTVKKNLQATQHIVHLV